MVNPLLDSESPPRSSWLQSPVTHAYRTYLAFLQDLFRGPEDQALIPGVWYSDDPQVTKLNILGRPSVDVRLVTAKPTIVVSPQASSGGAQIIGDLDHVDFATGKITYMDYFRGALAVYVLSEAEISALSLAEMVRDQTWAHQRTLIQNGKFHNIGRGIVVGPALPPGSVVTGQGREKVRAVPVTVPFAFLRRTSVEPRNVQRLRSLVLTIGPRAPVVDEESFPIAPGTTIEEWVRDFNRARGYLPPTDPVNIPAALPTETSDGGESLATVEVQVDVD